MRGRRFASMVVGTVVGLCGMRAAEACGCFAPPNTASPVVQAGERILFARENGIVTAHIQIQYSGSAQDFGWLLPLPSVPMLELGSDELFAQLLRATQPTYTVSAVYDQCFASSAVAPSNSVGVGCAGGEYEESAPAPGPLDARALDAATGGPLIVEDSIGPYDYAVLKADSDREMLDWLVANHYFVPAGTDVAVQPYIHPGAYFLALRLRTGKSAGDVQPVIVKYASDLPMIPIVLTQVGAVPDMGIQVWMLARGRAIPRNYAHTVLNDAQLDWLNGVRNYNAVVIRATKEAAGRHTFITEYAGPASVMSGTLAPPGRFGTQAELAAQTTMDGFGGYLQVKGFGAGRTGALPSLLINLLRARAPMPPGVAARGVNPSSFYLNIAYYRMLYAADMAGWPETYAPEVMAAEIFERVVEPMRAAEQLFAKYPMLTRLYTTLSPGDMTRDPVFTENATLPAVSRFHSATVTYHCGGTGPASASTPATLQTEQGYVIPLPGGTRSPPGLGGIMASRRIESLLEEGEPNVLVDNDATIAQALAGLPPVVVPVRPAPQDSDDEGRGRGCGCGVSHRGRYGGLAIMALLTLSRLRRRRAR